MEGIAKDHAANIDQYRVLTALEILEGMDRLYRVSMTFQLLNAALCGLQQRAAKTCRDYYDHFTQITVLLWERHSNHFHPGELARMSKDCFYAGLRAEHRPMVVHLKDHPNSTPLDLLVALMENEQNDILANARYPPATSLKMAREVRHTDHPRPPRHTDRQDRYANQKTGGYAVCQIQMARDEHARDHGDTGEDGYIICPVQLDAEPVEDQSNTGSPMLDPNITAWMDQGFHCGMVQAADRADTWFRCCFNCLEEGHRWRDCKKTPLLPELQDILDREALNRMGSTGNKGGWTPWTPGMARERSPRWPNPPSETRIKGDSLLLLEPGCPVLLARSRELRLGPSWWDTN